MTEGMGVLLRWKCGVIMVELGLQIGPDKWWLMQLVTAEWGRSTTTAAGLGDGSGVEVALYISGGDHFFFIGHILTACDGVGC